MLIVSLILLLISFYSFSFVSVGVCDEAPWPVDPGDPEILEAVTEARQIAFIDVQDSQKMTLHLYLATISLDEKPHNLSIIIPLPSLPTKINGTRKEEAYFYGEHDILDLIERAENQNFKRAISNLFEDTRNILNYYTFSSLLSLASLPLIYQSASYSSVSGGYYRAILGKGGHGRGLVAHYVFEGMTIDIYELGTNETLSKFIAENNITSVDWLQEVLQKYGSYYVAVIRCKADLPVELTC